MAGVASRAALGGEVVEIDLSQWLTTRNKSGYRGVYRESDPFGGHIYSEIPIDGNHHYLGTFSTTEEEAKATRYGFLMPS